MRPTNTQLKTCMLALTIIFYPLANTAYAQVYKSVDENGKVIFTDKPIKDAVPIELREPNTSKALQTSERATNKPSAKPPSYSKVEITSPADNTVMPNGLLPFAVSSNVEPALQHGHSIQLMLDGQSYSNNSAGSFTVSSLNRGPHTLEIRVVDSEKQTIKQSRTITINVYRPGGK